jgi:flagellar biosynthesis chaperone FliJ
MNANELADKLLEDLREIDLFNVDSDMYGNRQHYIEQLESVVRQQQAEIEALKLQVKGYQTSTKHYRKKADGDDDWELTRDYCS